MGNRRDWTAAEAEAEAAGRRAARAEAVAEAERRALADRAVRAVAEAEAAEALAGMSEAERQAALAAEAVAVRQAAVARREAAERQAEAEAVAALARWQSLPAAVRAVSDCPVPRTVVLPRDGREAAAVRMPSVVRPSRPVAVVAVPAAERGGDPGRTARPRHGRASAKVAPYDGYRKAVDTADGTRQAFLVTRTGVRVEYVCGHTTAAPCAACREAVARASVAADAVRDNGREMRPVRKAVTACRAAERDAWQAVARLGAFLPYAKVGGRGAEAVAALAEAEAEAARAAARTVAVVAALAALAAYDTALREAVDMPDADCPHAAPTLATLTECGAA